MHDSISRAEPPVAYDPSCSLVSTDVSMVTSETLDDIQHRTVMSSHRSKVIVRVQETEMLGHLLCCSPVP